MRRGVDKFWYQNSSSKIVRKRRWPVTRIFNFASVSRGRWESSFFNIEIGSHADAVVKHKSDAMPCGFHRMHATIRSTLFTRAGCSENSWKKAYANASYPTIRQMLPMISTRSIVNRDFCERPRVLGNYAFALKLSGRSRSLRNADDSSHLFVSTRKSLP